LVDRLFIKKDVLGKGLVRCLIDEAKTYARKNGAAYLEAFPVDPESPSYRHMGFVKTFEKAGFVSTHMVGTRRHAMIFKLESTGR
jgi:hypothetical protein